LDELPAILIAATESTPTMIELDVEPPENIVLLAFVGRARILARDAIRTPVLKPSLLLP
jgi:hypothetical protein